MLDEIVIEDEEKKKWNVKKESFVLKGSYRGLPVALKKLVVENEENFDHVKQLSRDFTASTHGFPQIIKIHGLYKIREDVHLVMEWVDINLHDLLHENTYYVGDKMRSQLLLDVCNVISWMFNNGKVHQNIKSTNILIDSKKRIKLTDFSDFVHQPSGSKYNIYQSPELYHKQNPDFSADLYSFGIIMWEIVHNLDPYHDEDIPKSNSPKINNIVFSKPDWISSNPKYDKYKSLYEKMTIFDRATRVEELTHTLIQDENQEIPLLVLGDKVSILGIIKELRNAQKQLVDLPSEIGSYIWNKATENSVSKEHTNWEIFYEQFQSKFSVVMSKDNKDPVFGCFKLILGTYSYTEITRMLWEMFSTWFSFALASDDKVNELLDFIKDLYETGWYFGFTDKDSVENKITEKKKLVNLNWENSQKRILFIIL